MKPGSKHARLPPWDLSSWREKPVAYQPEYRRKPELRTALSRLKNLPPIVFPGEVDRLRTEIADAAKGNRFILHGGDCVERFIDCNPQTITNKLKILLQMSVVLSHAARRPVVRVGRMAGQYFKPRSSTMETLDGQEVLTYRGDTVHGYAVEDREPDPNRLVDGYFHAAATLNYIRSMIDGGFADLHDPYNWNLDSIESSTQWDDYRSIVESILDAIHFMESFGGVNPERLGRIEFFTSHEGLHLDYETAMTRPFPDREAADSCFYNVGAHLLWIGERTRNLDGAHVEYFRGIQNPVGVKLSSRAEPDDVAGLCTVLNPGNEPGRLCLITRLGAASTRESLPPIINAVQSSGMNVTWLCDPMHGNNVSTADGRKTRRFADVLRELELTAAAHREADSVFGGVHFELTGDNVTECTGGSVALGEDDLHVNYQSYCDPRLNYSQSMEMAFLISRFLRAR